MPDAAIGRIVQYVLAEGRSRGESRPAQILSIFTQSAAPPLLNLVVTLDGLNDGIPFEGSHQHLQRRAEGEAEEQVMTMGVQGGTALHIWRTSIPHAEAVGSPPTFPPGTWHWPSGVS